MTFPNPRTEYGGFSYQLDDMYAFDCIYAVRRMWLIIRKLAKVIVHIKDRYGRNVGAVTCDGVNANEKMVESGLAWVYTQYAAANSPLFRLEQQARLAKRGLWRDANPVPPWEWRKRR